MKTLFICHSVGDTHTAIKVAKELLKKVQNEAFFLAIHPNAQKCLTHSLATFNQERIHITGLGELFESSIQEIADVQLNAKIIHYVEDHHIQNALVGTPSHNTETRFFDITKSLTSYFSNQHVFVYNDYLFEDTTHAYWTILNKESSWEKQLHWLVPFPGTHQKVTEQNSALTLSDVSHPIIDEAFTRETIETEAVHPALASNENYAFIYISGSKNPDQDIEFLTALFQGLSPYPAFHFKIPRPNSGPHACAEIDEKTFSQDDVTNTPKLPGVRSSLNSKAAEITSVCFADLPEKPTYVHNKVM